MFDVKTIRQDFPILNQQVNGKSLVYLDSTASSQKPLPVIEAMNTYYREYNANVHRGIYHISEKASEAYETARKKVGRFINARSWREIIFTRNATESINLVAYSWGRANIKAGDVILTSEMEHHANLIPWQQICQQTGAKLTVIPINQQGELELAMLPRLLNNRTKLLAVTHISNSLGTINPIKAITQRAHEHGIPVLVDGAQSAAHHPIDVVDLDCDFFVFSGHKMFAPSGIGVLYAKAAHLEKMPPYRFGGEAIRSVTFAATTFAPAPTKFEPGTPNVEGAIGLGAAMGYINAISKKNIQIHLREMLAYATEQLSAIDGLRIIGTAEAKSAILSFTLADIHPHDAATYLGEAGIAVRAGHHCTQPVMQFFGIPGTLRASFSIYNTKAEIDHLAETIRAAKRFFK